MSSSPRTEKHEQARSTLPGELKPVFDELVEDDRSPTRDATLLNDTTAPGYIHDGQDLCVAQASSL